MIRLENILKLCNKSAPSTAHDIGAERIHALDGVDLCVEYSMTSGKRCALFILAALCAGLTSCTTIETGSPSDYIGPSERRPAVTGHEPSPAATVSPAPAVPEPAAPQGPLHVTVPQAILLALENNRSLAVDRYNPQLHRIHEAEQRAVFDPDVTEQLLYTSNHEAQPGTTGALVPFSDTYINTLGLTEFLPTGTTFSLSSAITQSHYFPFVPGVKFIAQEYLTVTQSLLRGYGTDVNLAALRQARLDTKTSQYELRGFAESIVAQTEEAYWDCIFDERQIAIFTQSLALAQKSSDETHERVRLGDLAGTEIAAADAEVALRREDLINARSALAKARIILLRLISPSANAFHTELVLEDQPQLPQEPVGDEEDHVQLGLRMRSDLNQARLQVQRGDLSVVMTRNGLLPLMNVFVTFGRTGYSEAFDKAVRATVGSQYTTEAGVNLEFPPINRNARAQYTGALLTRKQSLESVNNLEQLVESDVRTAYSEVLRAGEQVTATAVSRKLQEARLKSETGKFRVGQSTTFLVGQAQRDLLSSQINEINVVVTYRKALVEIYRLEGSLLQRRGITAPGAAAPDAPPFAAR
jgi:outer membrane protein TolC